MSKIQRRKSFSVKQRSARLLKSLAIKRGIACSAYLDNLIEAAARVEGVTLPEDASTKVFDAAAEDLRRTNG